MTQFSSIFLVFGTGPVQSIAIQEVLRSADCESQYALSYLSQAQKRLALKSVQCAATFGVPLEHQRRNGNWVTKKLAGCRFVLSTFDVSIEG